jgi:hypothetical protein
MIEFRDAELPHFSLARTDGMTRQFASASEFQKRLSSHGEKVSGAFCIHEGFLNQRGWR